MLATVCSRLSQAEQATACVDAICATANVACLRFLVEQKADLSVLQRSCNRHDVLVRSVDRPNLHDMRFLLDHGIHPGHHRWGVLLLKAVTNSADEDVIEMLMKRHIYEQSDLEAALLQALCSPNRAVAEVLLKSMFFFPDEADSVLEAVFSKCTVAEQPEEAARWLIQHPSLNQERPCNRERVRMLFESSVRKGYFEIAQELYETGRLDDPDLSCTNEAQRGLIHLIVRPVTPGILRALLASSYDDTCAAGALLNVLREVPCILPSSLPTVIRRCVWEYVLPSFVPVRLLLP